MFIAGAPNFTPHTKNLRNARMDMTAFAAPEVCYPISVLCAAAIIFRNVFAVMKVSM